jgi:hypothetical protein
MRTMFQSTAQRGFTSCKWRDSPILVLLALLPMVAVANGFLHSRPPIIHHQHEVTCLAARQQRRKSTTAAFYASTEDPPLPRDKMIVTKSFGNRMRDLVLKDNQVEKMNRQQHDDMSGRSKINPSKPAFVHEAVTLQSYKELVADEHEKLVVVRFYAKWCRVRCRCFLVDSNGNVSLFVKSFMALTHLACSFPPNYRHARP